MQTKKNIFTGGFEDIPEAIILTMPVAFFKDRNMSYHEFCKLFEETMSDEDSTWNFVKKNLPIHDVAFVYIVFDGFVQYRTNMVSYERNKTMEFYDAPDGKVRRFDNKNWIILSGPAIIAPYDIPMKGFQGHRYSKKLF